MAQRSGQDKYPTAPKGRPDDFEAAKFFGGKKLDELPSDWRVYAVAILDWSIQKLKSRIDQSSEPAYRFLSFANAGGIALMIGMVPSFLEHCLPTIPLMLAAITFTIGMIFLGVRIVIDLHLDTAVCQDLINDKRLVLKFQVTPDKAYENYLEGQNNPRRKLFTRAPFRLLAFVCFIMGCLIAIGGIVWVVEIADGLQSKKECVTAKKAD